MAEKSGRWWIVALVVGGVLTVAGSAWGQGVTTFEGFGLEDGKLLFTGESRTSTEGDTVREVVIYKNPAGEEVQKVEMSYDASTLRLISYHKEDHRSGETESMSRKGDTVELRYRKAKGEDEDTETLDWSDTMSFSAVITPQMRKAWGQLEAGKEVEVDFLVPSRLETVGFWYRNAGETNMGGETVMQVVMEPSTWVIRKLVDPLNFFITVDAAHRLVEYHGRVTLKTADGEDIDARLVYHYNP